MHIRRALPALALLLTACVGEVISEDDVTLPGLDQASVAQQPAAPGNVGVPPDAGVASDGFAVVEGGTNTAPPASAYDASIAQPTQTPDASVAPDPDPVDASTAAPDAGPPPAPQTPDVPDISACADAVTWPADASQWEREVLEYTNQARAVGHDCGSSGKLGPAAPLAMEPHLRCSARLHSAYMARTLDFNHTQTATGLDPFERMAATGYESRASGENIAAGQGTPRAVVDGWLDSDGHCSNIMNPDYTQIGVGYALASGGYRHYWTQNFGTPR